jgi:flagellar basal-body rod modification protein FlgD
MSTIAHALASASQTPSTTSPATTGTAGSSGSSASSAAADPLANESTFLTLLVSQLQNQDPLDPVDSNQFVTQLTGYSQLEQLIGIHSDTTTLDQSIAGTTPASTTNNTTPGAN